MTQHSTTKNVDTQRSKSGSKRESGVALAELKVQACDFMPFRVDCGVGTWSDLGTTIEWRYYDDRWRKISPVHLYLSVQ